MEDRPIYALADLAPAAQRWIEQRLHTQGVRVSRDNVLLLEGDAVTALVLSQIEYWHLPVTTGRKVRFKLSIYRDDRWWLAKDSLGWWYETGLSRKQIRRALEKLRNLGLIQTRVWLWDGAPTTHVWLDICALQTARQEVETLTEEP